MTFNAKASRAKRPCPLWVDAFQRDTQHLEADEVGAYMLILMAMWTRESCDFPDDDNRLARVSRVSLRLWKSRLGPQLRLFFRAENGVLISKRLREEATYVERQVTRQSSRKAGENPDNPLDGNGSPRSADRTVDQPRHHPSQQPNNPTEEKKITGSVSPTSETVEPFEVPLDEEVDEGFAEFWRAYPKRTGRLDAEAAFLTACVSAKPEAIIAGAKAYASFSAGQEPRFLKEPANWLRDKRWLDELKPPEPSKPVSRYRAIVANHRRPA